MTMAPDPPISAQVALAPLAPHRPRMHPLSALTTETSSAQLRDLFFWAGMKIKDHDDDVDGYYDWYDFLRADKISYADVLNF